MFRNMANSVIRLEQVVTTAQKAKEVRRVVDRLITLGKGGTNHQRRLAFDRTRDKVVVEKLFDELAKRYKTRAGGYTRVLKMADRRWGDAAEMAVLELMDRPEISRKRKSAAPAPGTETNAPSAELGPVSDPTAKFRKMFGQKKAGGAKAAKAADAEGGTEKKAAKKKPASKKAAKKED